MLRVSLQKNYEQGESPEANVDYFQDFGRRLQALLDEFEAHGGTAITITQEPAE